MLCTSADPYLGGRDFDVLITNHFAAEFKKKFKVDAKSKMKAYCRLLQECEKLKKLMSANATELPLNIECFMDDKDVSGRMKRSDYEDMSGNLIKRIEDVFRSVLDNASKYYPAISIWVFTIKERDKCLCFLWTNQNTTIKHEVTISLKSLLIVGKSYLG